MFLWPRLGPAPHWRRSQKLTRFSRPPGWTWRSLLGRQGKGIIRKGRGGRKGMLWKGMRWGLAPKGWTGSVSWNAVASRHRWLPTCLTTTTNLWELTTVFLWSVWTQLGIIRFDLHRDYRNTRRVKSFLFYTTWAKKLEWPTGSGWGENMCICYSFTVNENKQRPTETFIFGPLFAFSFLCDSMTRL